MSFIAIAMALFALGLYGVLTRRDIVGILASVEVMLGAATLLLVGLGTTSGLTGTVADGPTIGATGLMIMVLAAAEAAVALGILVVVARRLKTTRIDELTEVKG